MRDPDRSGFARAWLIETSDEAIAAHVREWGYPPTSLRSWIVNGPYHMLWSWWMVGLISLRDVPGIPPANKQYPEAEYELTFLSLKGTPNIDALDRGDLAHRDFEILSPADLVFHFHKVTDEQAIAICDVAVDHIVAGQSCDSDYREWWKDTLARTVEHYVLGVHQ